LLAVTGDWPGSGGVGNAGAKDAEDPASTGSLRRRLLRICLLLNGLCSK
jgi:hypothetical protein